MIDATRRIIETRQMKGKVPERGTGDELDELVRLFLRTPFEGGRHARRLKKVANLDRARR